MKKISIFFFGFLLFLQFLFVGGAWGQSTANYAFTTNTTGSLALDANGNAVDMSIGTSVLLDRTSGSGYPDDIASSVMPIGFNFIGMGASYSNFSVNTNGAMALGNSVVGTSGTSNGGSTTALFIAAFGGDQGIPAAVGSTARIHYKLIGSAPNRILIVEWNNMKMNFTNYSTATSGDGTYQVRLYETTGVIEFVYGSMNVVTAFVTGPIIGFSAGTTASKIASITSSTNAVVTNGTSFSNNIYTTGNIANLNSTANGSRRVYKFTPLTITTPNNPTSLTFTAVTITTETPNWVDNSSDESFFIVTRANDAGFTTGVVVTNVASTTTAGTGATYTLVQTGLTPGTTYHYKIQAANEAGVVGSGLTGSQATTAGATYYWVGATGGTWNTPTNWNTAADNTGTTRATVATTDVLIIDGEGTTSGGAMSISVDLANFSIGQLKVTSNTALTLASSATTTRTITITGGGGDDFIIENGSSLILNSVTKAVAFAFSGTGMTGTIGGTLSFAGSTSNVITTTGGTGTLLTVSATGVVNNSIVGSSGCLTGSVATLSFLGGSNYTHSSFTTSFAFIPTATWAATATATLTGGTTSSGLTSGSTSLGNLVINMTGLTGGFNASFSGVTIQGDLTINSTGTGTGFRLVSTGTATVNGNVNVNAGTFATFSLTGTINVLGNTTVASGATFNLSLGAGIYSQRGSTFTNNGIIIGSTATPVGGALNFFSPTNAPLTFAGSGTVTTPLISLGGQTTGGITITHTNQIPVLRVNLFTAPIINSNKLTIGSGAAFACAVQVGYSGSTIPGGSFDQSPTWNLGAGTYSLIYSQELGNRTTGFEIPPTRTVNNITNSNSNGLTINGGALSSAALTFSSGCGNITTSSSNVLTITGTTTSAITRTSTTAYVNGPLELTLPASLATVSTYLFPIGKTALYPFELVNPTTNAGGTVVIKAEVFDGDAGGTAGNIMATLSTSRYWAASVTSGSSNLTNTNIRLTDASTTGFDAIANSATVTGAYDIAGGTTSTVTSTTILSGTPLTSLSGYYLMGSKAAATLATPSITPTGNRCANVSRAISVLITPGGGAVTTVNLNYSINGTAQTAIAMTNTTNNGGFNADTWTATIPTVTPVNAAITWSITATDANSLTRTITGTGYQDAPNTGITATATATPSTVCDGSNASLSLSVVKSGVFTIGSGTTTTALIVQPTAFCNRWPSYRMQLIYTASELSSQGLSAGSISSMAFNIISAGSANTNANFTVLMQNTSTSAFGSTSWESTSGATTVYPAATYTHTASGWQTITFSTPFVWDGSSNVLIDISMDGANSTNNSETYYSTTATNQIIHSGSSGKTSSTGTQANTRLNIQFGGFQLTPSAYSWSNGTTVVGTTNPLSTPITSGLTYTATATVNGCPMTAAVTPTVNPLPTAPTGTPSSQCGAGIPTASVADNNSYTTPTFKWYSAATGGTLLQNSTSVTYTTSISATTTFYVAVVGTNTCESARTAVTVTISQPDAISASASVAAICLGQSVTLTAANTATTPTQTYSYSWACATTGSGATSANTNNPASITPSAAGSYTYTVTATDGGCSAVNTVVVTVNALPNITSATATPSTVCSGEAITLTGASVPASTGTSIASGSGTSTSTSSSYPSPFGNYYWGAKQQFIITAADLSAMGLIAGNITSVAFDITSAATASLTNFAISAKHTNTAAFTSSGTFETGLTTLYSSASYSPSSSTGYSNNTITFNTPFAWNGTSNIVFEICFNNNAYTSNASSTYTTKSYYTACYYIDDASGICSQTNGSYISYNLPNMKFSGQIGTNQTSSFSWSWNSTPAISSETGTTTETNTGASASTRTYTVTATNATTGCTNTATTSAISINPATVAPTASNSSQCGTATPTCSVTGTGASGNIFKWYLAATGGTALVGQSASTLSSYPVSATTSFYVSEFNGTCESARVQVDVTIIAAPTISAAASVNPVCSGSATTLSVTSSNSDYTYTWSNSAGTGASVSVNPTSATNYTVTATDASGGANNGCITTASISISTNSLPTAISLSPSTSTNLCLGDVKTIVASGGNIVSQGTVTLGTGTTTLSTTASYAAFNGYRASSWIQTIYTASELSALGLVAGNITSIAYNINSQGSSTSNNITIKIGTISATSFATTTLLSTSAFTTVYGPTAYTHTASGWQTINFATPYNWDGVSNIVVDVWQDGPDSSFDPATYFSTTSDNKVNYTWNVTPSVTPPTGVSTTSRFNVRFNGNISSTLPITWSPTSSLFTNSTATTAYTGNPTTVYAKPTATTTYTATATSAAGCTSSASVAVTIATPSTQTLATNDYVWKGTTTTDWSTASNWVKYDGAAYPVASNFPSATDNVFIPQNNTCVVSQPSIGTATVTVNTVYIEPSATVTGGSGTLDVNGNFTNNGTFTAGTGTVSFTGTAAQQVTGATTFYNLTQYNSDGLTLNNPVTVANNLTMMAGNITTTPTNILTLGNSAPASLTWTSGKVVGPMKRWMAAATNSGASSSMFPLGNATRKAQASIEYTTAPTTAGYLEAKFIATSPANACSTAYATLTDQFNYVLNNVVTEGYWEIKPSAANTLTDGAYTVTLEGDGVVFLQNSNSSFNDVRVIKSPDPHNSWVLQGAHGTATGANADFTVSRTGMSGYSFFAMAYPTSAPLPIELVSFAANCDDNNTVSVNWTTASEHNSDYYTVEKSRDGIAWNILATKAAAGNSTQLIHYSVADVADISGTVYYRLTQVDVDGASKMYDIVSTNCSSEKELALIAYPNPSNGQFTVKIENALGGQYDLAITDMQGKAIEEQSLDLETGTTVVKLNLEGLQPGVYLLQFMQDGNKLQQQKLVIE